MSKPKLRLFNTPSTAVRYAVAVISVATALIFAKLLDRYWHSTPFTSLFICAVMFSGWFGGFRPGALAIVLSIVAFDYYFLPPTHSLRVNWNELPRLILFALATLTVGLVAALQRTNTESIEQTRDHLAEKVLELNRINDALQAENAERKRVEDALRRSEAYLAEAQRISLTGSFGWNVSSGELFWSDETYRIIGIDPGTKPTIETVFQRIHPEDVARVQDMLERAVRVGADLDFEHRLRMPDATIKYVHVLAHAVHDKSGDLEYIGSTMDITATRRAEEALREAQANLAHVSRVTTVGELAASIAHEVNQPLGAVVNNANACLSLLPNNAPHLQEVRDALAEIIDDVDRAGTVISRVRQLTRKVPIERVLLDLRKVVTDVLILARYECTARRVTIRADLPGEQLPVLGDRVQLQQVLLNLVVNGMDAMNTVEESKRFLLIRGYCEMRDGVPEFWLGVQDAGIGFKPEQLDRLFEAFYTTKPRGMGMGLAISRSIIEAHGGRLWAEPNPDCGATFLFNLPAAGAANS